MTRLLETLNPIEALVHETLNGEYELTFTTTARDVNKFDLLSAHTPNGRQLFRVAGVTNHADKSEIFARHVFFDLSGNFSLGFESKDVTCQTMINKFVSSLTEPLAPFALSTDITARNSYNPEEANALEILSHGKRSIVGVNEAELLRDNYAVKLQKRLGSDTNVLIHPRNNILDLKREYSSDDICTKIFLRGGTEEAPLEATITSPLIDKYPVVYARRYQNETDSITTVEQLIAWGKLHFDTDRIDVPKLSFDFDVFGDLGLQLGDSALVRVPELDVDVRSRVTGYDYDPMTQKYVKLYFGDKSTGLAGFIGDTTTGIVDEAVKNVDEKLQAEIDNANEAIQKEYEARVEAVNDAIAKAEADAEVMKEALQTEISQAVTDWNTEFEEAKQNIDNSIENVSKELGEYIESTDEIIERVDSELSDLFTGIEANSGAITSITTEQGILSAKVGEVVTTADSALSKATEAQMTADGFSTRVGSLETSDNTQNSKLTKLEQTADGLTSTVSTHTTEINGLNSTVSTHSSEIKQTSDKISMVVSNGSTASAVQLTPNALTAIAKDINLKGNVQFNSLVEGDGTNTQILGGKIKTGSISASKLMISGNSSLVKFLQGEYMQGADFKPVASGQQSVIRKEGVIPVAWLVRETESNAVKFTDFNSATITSGSIQLVVKYRLDSNFTTSDSLVFEIHGYDRFGAWVKMCYRSSALASGNIEHRIKIDYTTNELHHFGIRFRLADNLDTSGRNFTLSSFSLLEMNAGELIVDGAIRANHIVSGSAELGAVTSKVLSTEALNAAWANIGNAFINKLTSDDALFQRLTAKQAWITSANIVSLDASKTTTGVLKSQNGRVVFDLNNAILYANASNGNKYIQVDQDGVKLHNPSSTSAAQWGQLYAQNNRFTIRSRGDSRGLSLGYDLNDSYQECAFFSATSGNVQFLKQVQFNTEGHFKGGYNRFGQEGQGYFEIWGNSGAHKINPNAGNTGSLGDGTRYFNSSWVANRNNPSSLEFKNVSHYLDDSESLNLVKNVGVARYFYKGDEFVSKNSQTGLIYEDVRDQPQRDLLTNEEDKAINIYNMNSVLWSAVRALNENLNAEIGSLRAENEALRTDVTTLRDELALERSERETLRDDVATLRTQLNALTDLIAGKATVTVRT